MCGLSSRLRLVFNIPLLFFTFRLFAFSAEGISGLLRLADSLAGNGLRSEAAVEYRRAICFSSDSNILCPAYYGLGLQYRDLGEFEKAGKSFISAADYAPGDSLRDEIKLTLASVLISAGNTNIAMMTLFPLSKSSNFRQIRLESTLLLFICAVRQHNWEDARNYFSEYLKMDPDPSGCDSSASLIIGILSQAESTSGYSPGKSKLLSVFLPGLGQVYSGDLRGGINSLVLNSFNFWVVGLNIVRADYIGAILYFLFVTERYYSGNLYRAEEAAVKANIDIDERFEKQITGKFRRLFVPAEIKK